MAHFLKVSAQELKTFARVTRNTSVHGMSMRNLITADKEIAEYTGIRHAGEAAPGEIPFPIFKFLRRKTK